MTFCNFFHFWVCHFCPPRSGSGYNRPKIMWIHVDPESQDCPQTPQRVIGRGELVKDYISFSAFQPTFCVCFILMWVRSSTLLDRNAGQISHGRLMFKCRLSILCKFCMQVRWYVFRTGTGNPLPSFADYKQCCGSGSGIRCFYDSGIRDG